MRDAQITLLLLAWELMIPTTPWPLRSPRSAVDVDGYPLGQVASSKREIAAEQEQTDQLWSRRSQEPGLARCAPNKTARVCRASVSDVGLATLSEDRARRASSDRDDKSIRRRQELSAGRRAG